MTLKRWMGTICLAVGVGGCSGGTNNNGMDMASLGQLEIFSWWVNPGESDALRALLDVYRSVNPGSTVVNTAVNASGTQASQDVASRVVAGMSPDTFQLSGSGGDVAHWTKFTGTAGSPISPPVNELVPLDDLYASQNWFNVMPSILTDALKGDDGHIYILPVDMHRQNTMFYNKTMFTKNGWTPPTTWDEFLAMAPTIEAKGISPLALGLGTGSWTTNIVWENVLIGTAGLSFRQKLEHGQADLSTTSTPDAVTLQASLHKLYKVLTHINFATANNLGWDQAAELLHTGQAAMYVHGDWVKGYYQALGWQPGIDFDTVDGPGTQGVFLFNSDGFAITTGAPNPLAAKAFLTVFGSKDGQVAFNSKKGSSPARNDVDLSQLDPVAAKTFAELTSPNTTLVSLADTAGAWGNDFGCWLGPFTPPNAAVLQADEDAAVATIFANIQLCAQCDITGNCPGTANTKCYAGTGWQTPSGPSCPTP
jgi:glucose/mannose transport system substrate-binding protein